MGVPPASLAPTSKQPTRLPLQPPFVKSVPAAPQPCANGGCSAVRLQSFTCDLALRSIFPRNETQNSAKYFSERPEMIPHETEDQRRPKKQKINEKKKKIIKQRKIRT